MCAVSDKPPLSLSQAGTHKNTPCSGVPGPKLNPRKILLLLRLFITAVLRHVREGKEQERQGANMTPKRQNEWRSREIEKTKRGASMRRQKDGWKTWRQMWDGNKSQKKQKKEEGDTMERMLEGCMLAWKQFWVPFPNGHRCYFVWSFSTHSEHFQTKWNYHSYSQFSANWCQED